MQVVTESIVSGKKVILRLDIDVALRSAQGKLIVVEDFRLKAGLPTINLCLKHASQVIIIGHIGRPEGKIVPELSVEPVRQWLLHQGLNLEVLENLRFDSREEAGDLGFAKELAAMGEIYINEAFASYHRAVSTTVLPTLLPSCAGLRFAKEVKILTNIRDHPKKPFVVIMGGVKVKDKLPVIQVLAKIADAVLVGGKLVSEIRAENLELPENVMVGKLNKDGFDIAPETIQAWSGLIQQSRMIVWNGPLGKISNIKYQISNMGSARGSYEIAKLILESRAEVVVGGGDTVGFLGRAGLLNKFENKGFVSVGGGAMLKFLAEGTLKTIEALE